MLMFSFYTSRIFKALCFFVLFFTIFQYAVLGQATYRITKPFLGTNQICSSSSNGYSYLSYAFSSNVENPPNSNVYHSVELANDFGLITPKSISYAYPNLNIIYVGNFEVNGQNLPAGSGYRIRVTTSTPSVASEWSEPFTVLPSPARPILDVGSGSINLCPGITQNMVVTNPNNAVTYQWQNNSANIPNATSTSYSTSTSGYYSIKATHPNGCSISSYAVSIYQNSPLGSNLIAQRNNYSTRNPLFVSPNEPFSVIANMTGGKSPYNFTLNNGITNTVETNINYSKTYSFIAPASGSKTYTISTITDACGSQINNSSSTRVRVNDSKYCSVSGSATLGIKNFSIQGTTINNLNSSKALDGWGEYLTPANINANVNYSFSITPISSTASQQNFAIWADLNQNGTFDTNEKVFPTGNNAYQSITTTFTGVLKLPASAFNGQTRMRVMLSNDYWYYVNPCTSLYDGEIEDYVLNIFNGVVPTVISTNAVPASGICDGQILPVSFTVSGTTLPVNTVYRLEAANYSDFANPFVLARGTSSPISFNSTGLSYNNQGRFFLRVVTDNIVPNVTINQSPNSLLVNVKPEARLVGGIYNAAYYPARTEALRKLSVEPTTSTVVWLASASNNSPIAIELSDGRIFGGNTTSGNFYSDVEVNLLSNTDRKFKIIRVSDNVCTNNKPDSLMITVGTPMLKILKVQKTSVDTTSITKICGTFVVRFAGEHLDSLTAMFYQVQLSDLNGSFTNPVNIGQTYLSHLSNENEGGQYVDCFISSSLSLPSGTGYKLRIVKKSANVISPTFLTNFELINSTVNISYNLSKNIINEGEVAPLNINFSGGISPYNITLNTYNRGNRTFSTGPNNSTLVVNLSPLYSEKYTLSYNSACYNYNGTTNSNIFLSVKTLDRSNAQWYVKPYQSSIFYELLRGTYLISGTDTLFKRPYNNSVSGGIINQYYDYNASPLLKPATVLRTGENYSLAQIYSSNYGATNLLTGIWADLNQDGDFEDAGEELAKNDFSQFWSVSQSQNFTIPTNSNIGFSRLRVRVVIRNDNQPFTFNASDPIDKYADTYDIPIVILSNAVSGIISTPNISGNMFCNGNSFNINYDKYGIPSGTNATVELSDASGNFTASPPVIGQGTDASINVTLPMNITSGNYKIRVVSNGIISPSTSAFAVITNTLASMVDGDWHAGSTWSCGRVPTVVDDVTVSAGTNITVFSGDARVGSLITNGVLSFLNGTQLKFKVP
jgi:hypothetical protein